MITIIIYDSISFIKLPMNDSKEITLFVDNYNSNHSDAVLLVANYLSKDKNLSAEIIISKQRHGPTGVIQVQFEAKLTRFMDLVQNENLPDQIY